MIQPSHQSDPYVAAKNVTIGFELSGGRKLVAVDDVSFEINRGEILGVVGESGSGKTILAKSILQLVPPPGKIEQGSILIDGVDVLQYSDEEMRKHVRGTEVSMIFQEPLSALNPSFSVEWQIEEVFRLHTEHDRNTRRQMAAELLRKVSIPDPERRIKEYPHQFSGGMQQRVLIAIALACDPKLLIADEPTTALDVTVQADIMDLLQKMREETGLAILLISHNLNLVTERSDRIMVLYASQLMEMGLSERIAEHPLHPYTIGLMDSVPDIEVEDQKITAIPGEMPDLTLRHGGCVFQPRCKMAMEVCERIAPELIEVEPRHACRCHLFSSEHSGVNSGGR